MLSFDGEKIIISRKQIVEEFLKLRKENKLILLNYYNGSRICTKIVADYTDKDIAFENYTDNPIELAFGVNQTPAWDDYEAFLEERCVPRERDGLREMLETLGLYEYNLLEIIKKTQGKMAEDNCRLETEEL